MFGLGKKKEHEPLPKKYLVRVDVPKCIGAGVCEAFAPTFFTVNEHRKVDIREGQKLENGWQEREITDLELENVKQAAEGCPPKVIHIINKETGEQII